jgi:hypothetical protein
MVGAGGENPHLNLTCIYLIFLRTCFQILIVYRSANRLLPNNSADKIPKIPVGSPI